MSDPVPIALPEVFRLSCPACGLVVLVGTIEGRWGCTRCRGAVAVEPVIDAQLVRAWEASQLHFGNVEVMEVDPGIGFLYDRPRTPFEEMRGEYEGLGYLPFLRRVGRLRLCRIVPRPPRKPMLLARHVVLFVLTLATTLYVGYASGEEMVAAHVATSATLIAVAYAAALFAILGGHEMGHFVVAKLTGTEASLPYFLPGPPPVGTFGAMISLRTPAPNRDTAILLGAAGPIVGFLLSIPTLWYGLRHSVVLPAAAVPGEGPAMNLGEPLLFRWLAPAGLLARANHVILHPVAFAGWIGLFATCLNLLPMGQLDGGHIARALLGESKHRHFSLFVVGILFVLGMSPWGWHGWVFWAFVGLLISMGGHPGALDEVRPLRPWSWWVAGAAVAIFAMSATPSPFSAAQ